MKHCNGLFFLFFFAALCGAIGCKQEVEKEVNPISSASVMDSLVFGHFYGECLGDGCVKTFLLTKDALYQDTLHYYTPYGRFAWSKLPDTTFEEVKHLMDLFPQQLAAEPDSILGCPDCTDGGGLHIEYVSASSKKLWRIDQMQNNVPAYLHAFMDTVNSYIHQMKE